MNKWPKLIVTYLNELFNGWVGWISNLLTFLNLLLWWLFPNLNSLPLLNRMPREAYIFLAFVFFFGANLRIYHHLTKKKGPDIRLADPGVPHRCTGFERHPYPYNPDDRPRDEWGDPVYDKEVIRLESRLVIVNRGDQPGTLFHFSVEQRDDAIRHHQLVPDPSEQLPKTLQPGDEWTTTLHIYVKPTAGTLVGYAKNTDILSMQASYRTNNVTWEGQERVEPLLVGLDILHASLDPNGEISRTNVKRVQISRDKLLSIPEAERTFFLALGHLYNEINAITKLAYWTANTPSNNDAEFQGRRTMMLLLIRLLAGKLHESWQLFQQRFFGPKLSREYEPKLDRETSEALQSLKSYFGPKNAVTEIRNRFGFHYTPEEVSAVLSDVDGQLEVYMDPESFPNNLFYFCEVPLSQALLDLLAELTQDGIEVSLGNLIGEIMEVSLWFSQVSDGLMDAIIEKSGKELRIAPPEDVEFQDLRDFQEVIVPWFTETSNVISDSIHST